jgi:hypothetical protein
MGDYDPNNPAAIKRQARELVAKREVIAGMSEQE